jgi:signal transduction histidine kinase
VRGRRWLDIGGRPGSARARTERVLVVAALLFRCTGLIDIAVVIVTPWPGFDNKNAAWLVGLAVFVESAALAFVLLRAGRFVQRAMWFDVVFVVAAIAANATIIGEVSPFTWTFFMYGFSLPAGVVLGIAYPKYPVALAATTVLAVGYVVSATAYDLDPLPNLIPDTLDYFSNTTVVWLVVTTIRRLAGALDDERAKAVEQAVRHAKIEERARHARVMHDRVLQTLESLSRSDALIDPELRAHVAAESVWVRALVKEDLLDHPEDLLTRLQEVIGRKALLGLRVRLNDSALRRATEVRRGMSDTVVAALSGATEEALTNVTKHAGVDTAVVRVEATDGVVTVSVLDHGCGFDLENSTPGLGLSNSIRARVEAVGGTAHIESSTGAGTYVRLSAPAYQPDASAAC